MFAPLIVVTGTGTGIGKTHVSCAILRGATARVTRPLTGVYGYKPIESGVVPDQLTDQERLDASSSFHVKHPPRMSLRAALSPHLAAELEGASIDWNAMMTFISARRAEGVAMLVELPGGLFTPLRVGFRNVDAIRTLSPTLTVLVAANRLGVLHDVGASEAGARACGVPLDLIALVAPPTSDVSAETNAVEVQRFTKTHVVGPIARGDEETLKTSEPVQGLVAAWLGDRA